MLCSFPEMLHAAAHSVLILPLAGPLQLADGPSIWLTPAQWLSVAFMLGGMLILIRAFRTQARQTSSPVTPVAKAEATPPPLRMAAPALASHADPDPRTVVGDAEELLQLLAEQADQHAVRLERLIADADRRIKRLEQLAAAPTPRQFPEYADPLNQQVYSLSDEGMPPVEIARRLEQQTGKVELILALRRR
jgi:hypothetical protein